MAGFDYFSAADVEQFAFFRIPRALFKDKTFSKLSCEAKILYGLMLDRICLSIRNNWIDDDGHAYIIFQSDEISEIMGCGRQKTFKLLAELDTDGGIGLIERCRRGQGKASIIYVRNFNRSSGHHEGSGDCMENTMQNRESGESDDSPRMNNGQPEDGKRTASGPTRECQMHEQCSLENKTENYSVAAYLPKSVQNISESVSEADNNGESFMTDRHISQHKSDYEETLTSGPIRQSYCSGTLAFSENELLGISVHKQKEDKEVVNAADSERGSDIKKDDSADFQKYDIHTTRSMNSDTGEMPDIEKYDFHTSKNMRFILQEVQKSYSNNTDKSNTKRSKTESILSPLSSPRDSGGMFRTEKEEDEVGEDAMCWKVTRESVRDQIGYEALCPEYGQERVDQIVEIITDILASNRKSVMISGIRIPAEVVRGCYRKLNLFHIQYVFECLDATESRIKSMRRYLIATLYNAPSTMTEYYRNRVRADQTDYYNRLAEENAVEETRYKKHEIGKGGT